MKNVLEIILLVSMILAMLTIITHSFIMLIGDIKVNKQFKKHIQKLEKELEENGKNN